MELKQYLKIFKQEKKLFINIVLISLILGFLYYGLKPENYQVHLALNVTRSKMQETKYYKFDSFYRLQADERFADTIVRWLSSPRLVKDIFSEAKIVLPTKISKSSLSKKFKARRLSSQMVEINFTVGNSEPDKNARLIAKSLAIVVNKYAASLNEKQKEDSWFEVIGSEPVVFYNKPPFYKVLLLSLIIGLFFSFWGVLVKHYFKKGI